MGSAGGGGEATATAGKERRGGEWWGTECEETDRDAPQGGTRIEREEFSTLNTPQPATSKNKKTKNPAWA